MKRVLSVLLAIVLVLSALPISISAEESGGYSLEYESIGDNTYKIYILAENERLSLNEFRVYYDNVEVVSHQWYSDLFNRYGFASVSNNVLSEKHVVFCCGAPNDDGIYIESEYIGEVVVKLFSDNQTFSLVDGVSGVKYDEINLELNAELEEYTPSPEPDITPTPIATMEPPCTPVPVPPEIPTETMGADCTPVPTPSVNYELGDVDGNGSIDAKDALLVLQYAAKLGDLSEAQLEAANVDGDDNVNATDALNILKYAAKIIVRFVFDSEGNIEVLRDYIKENGTINENGNKEIKIDYVANGELDLDVAYDSLEYDEENDSIVYVFESADEEPENCMKFTITLNNTTETSVEIEWKQTTDNGVVDLKGESSLRNEDYSLDISFKDDVAKDYLEAKIPNYSSVKKLIWTSDMKDVYNGYVHSAFFSMEDFFSRTLVMYLEDIYESYKQNEEKLFEVTAPIYGIDYSIYENIRRLKAFMDIKGTKDGQYVYFKESYTGNSELGEDYYDVYLEKDTENDSLYFVLDMYHASKDVPILIYMYPFANREVYSYILLFEQNKNGEYEVSKEFYTVANAYEMDKSKSYEYTCVYPENASITKNEQEIIDQDIHRLLSRIEVMLSGKTSYELYDFGFTYFY